MSEYLATVKVTASSVSDVSDTACTSVRLANESRALSPILRILIESVPRLLTLPAYWMYPVLRRFAVSLRSRFISALTMEVIRISDILA